MQSCNMLVIKLFATCFVTKIQIWLNSLYFILDQTVLHPLQKQALIPGKALWHGTFCGCLTVGLTLPASASFKKVCL